MEQVGAVSEGEWSSLSGMYTTEEAEFMAQLLGNSSSIPNEFDPSSFWQSQESLCCSTDPANTNFYSHSQGSSYSSGGSSSNGGYYPSDSQQFIGANDCGYVSMDFYIEDGKNTPLSVFADGLMEGEGTGEEFRNAPEIPIPPSPAGKNKKKARSPRDAQKNKRNVKAKKNHKPAGSTTSNDQEDNNGGVSSSCSEDDESIVSQEMNGNRKESTAVNLNGKARAGRGSATDPQSLYARKRRERINERLRILQHLVPNGTKVDISTMLEEAVQYVKFLQLQIKLLSSDDLWMYAPIAYNGMDIGLDLKLTMPRK